MSRVTPSNSSEMRLVRLRDAPCCACKNHQSGEAQLQRPLSKEDVFAPHTIRDRLMIQMMPAHLILLPNVDKPCQGVLRSACRQNQLSSAARAKSAVERRKLSLLTDGIYNFNPNS